MKFAKNMLLATVLASAALSVNAQTVPKPKEFYFDEDKAAVREIVVVQGEGEALVQALLRERERGRKSTEASAQLAHVAFTEGRVDLGKQLYQQLLGSSDANGNLGRAVRWNYGWDLYRIGEHQAALDQWTTLLGTAGGPSWIPPTMALVLWKLDRKADAVLIDVRVRDLRFDPYFHPHQFGLKGQVKRGKLLFEQWRYLFANHGDKLIF